MTPEGYTKKAIKDLLDWLGAYYYMPVPGGYGKQTVDFLVCIRGHFVAIEAKRTGKRATGLQRYRMEEIRKAGGIAFGADSIWVCIEELRQHFVFNEIPENMVERWKKHDRKERQNAKDMRVLRASVT